MDIRKLCKIIAIISICLSLTTNVKAATASDGKTESDRIVKGVNIGDVDVSGLDKSAAQKKINEYINGFKSKKMTLHIDDKKVEYTVGDLGYHWGNKKIVNEAMNLCKDGNVIKRYKDKKDLEQVQKTLDLEVAIDETAISEIVNQLSGEHNVYHVNASLMKEGDSFTYTESSQGRVINVNRSVDAINSAIGSEWDGEDGEIHLFVEDDLPVTTIEDCKKVDTVIGTYSTSFSVGGSNNNRNHNINNGAKLLNGIVVHPGATFSANANLAPWTFENGYLMAGTYAQGQVVDDIGGGICQVSSTLYNALLLAELEIVERHPHSMTVGYVPLSADAALAGTWKDLKFKNTTDAPVYIEAIYSSGKIVFNLYGNETRQKNREVKYVSETLSTIPPKESVRHDPSKPTGYRQVTKAGQAGYTARLWKEVYQDGQMIDRVVVNNSTYQASTSDVIVGTGEGQLPGDDPSGDDPPEGDPPDAPASNEPQAPDKPTEKKTEKNTEKKTEKPTEKKTEKPTEKKTEKPTEKETEKPNNPDQDEG